MENNATLQLLHQVSGADNSARVQAEATLKAMRSNPEQSQTLFSGLLQAIHSAESLTIRTLACILLKKFFLDDRAEEEGCA
jgi:hypothetical protein